MAEALKIDRQAAEFMCKIAAAINEVTSADEGTCYVSEVRVAFDGDDLWRLTANDFEDFDLSSMPDAES